jgi:hypothetical protein
MTRAPLVALSFAIAVVASAAPARAEDWAALLPPAALATHLDGGARDLLVVGVGPARAAAETVRSIGVRIGGSIQAESPSAA